jgi:hypothetical protein
VLDADSICTGGLCFNDGLIRGCLAFVGKRQPCTYVRGPKRGGAVAGEDLVLRNASLQQRGTAGLPGSAANSRCTAAQFQCPAASIIVVRQDEAAKGPTVGGTPWRQ